MKEQIKPIPTKYNDILFRSRLEARWAVFFDNLPIEWEYEVNGFDLGGIWYLPDFWLPQVRMWAEVKPVELTKEESEKCKKLALLSGYECLELVGQPNSKPYWAHTPLGRGYIDANMMDYLLTNYENYPELERRFYCNPEEWQSFPDTKQAVLAACNMRFEEW